MPLWDGEEVKALRRIAWSLEAIEQILRRDLAKSSNEVRSVDMSLPTGPITVGTTGAFLATAADSGGNPVAGATPAVAGDDAGAFVTYSSDGANPATITFTAVADGVSNVTGSFTNADGTVISSGAGNPGVVTVAAAAADVTAVNFA